MTIQKRISAPSPSSSSHSFWRNCVDDGESRSSLISTSQSNSLTTSLQGPIGLKGFIRFPDEIKYMVYEKAMRDEGRFDRRLHLSRASLVSRQSPARNRRLLQVWHHPRCRSYQQIRKPPCKTSVHSKSHLLYNAQDETTLFHFLKDAVGAAGIEGLKHLELYPILLGNWNNPGYLDGMKRQLEFAQGFPYLLTARDCVS